MKHEATVVKVNGKYFAEIVRSEACGKCNACSFGQKEKLHFPLPEGAYTEGELVCVETQDKVLYKATMLAYALPLAMFLIGIFAGSALFKPEWAQALTGIVFLAASFAYLKITEKKRRGSSQYACRAHKINSDSEDDIHENL